MDAVFEHTRAAYRRRIQVAEKHCKEAGEALVEAGHNFLEAFKSLTRAKANLARSNEIEQDIRRAVSSGKIEDKSEEHYAYFDQYCRDRGWPIDALAQDIIIWGEFLDEIEHIPNQKRLLLDSKRDETSTTRQPGRKSRPKEKAPL